VIGALVAADLLFGSAIAFPALPVYAS